MPKPYAKSQILKETLDDWEDSDIAMYKLACSLGLLPPEDGSYDGFRDYKSLFFIKNDYVFQLNGILNALVHLKVLEFDEETAKYRWNPNWDPTPLQSI
jgi:hypothetical protein